jgi:quinol monooxygenase YgiN
MKAGVHVQVVTYRLAESVSDAEFIEANQEFAEMMKADPGLLAKIWLKNPADEVYGGLDPWQDREAYESFLASELWGSVVSDSVSDLTSHDFTVMDELTAETQPALQLL